MLSPEEKAKELHIKFTPSLDVPGILNLNSADVFRVGRKNAIICVDEIIEVISPCTKLPDQWEYWKKVKEHLTKM
jgi:hypothetical protein